MTDLDPADLYVERGIADDRINALQGDLGIARRRVIELAADLATASAEADQLRAQITTLREALASSAAHLVEATAFMLEAQAERDDKTRYVPREDFDSACGTVAEMHAAAVGSVRGPIRGVVEDVADLRAERDTLRRRLDEEDSDLQGQLNETSIRLARAEALRDRYAAAVDAALDEMETACCPDSDVYSILRAALDGTDTAEAEHV